VTPIKKNQKIVIPDIYVIVIVDQLFFKQNFSLTKFEKRITILTC